MWPISSSAIKGRSTGTILITVLAMVLASFLIAPAATATEAAYSSELTGWDIGISGPEFALESTFLEEYPHGNGERIVISGLQNQAVVELAFFDDTDTPVQTIEVAMREVENTSREFHLIDSGETDDGAYALARIRVSINFSGYVYIQVDQDLQGNIDLYQSIYMLNLDYGDAIATASDEISINGDPFLNSPMIDVPDVIANDQEAIASATPVHSEFQFTAFDSTIVTDPPISLNYDARTDVLEFVNLSSDASFGIVGYLTSNTSDPVSVVEEIFATAPEGQEAPQQIYRDDNEEHVVAVYRIDRDSGVTIMVIQVQAAGPGVWRVEAIAAGEADIVSDLPLWQQNVRIDGTPMLQFIRTDELDGILNGN